MAITTIPPTFYQIAFNADPNQALLPPLWTDQSWRVQFPWAAERGRQYELDANETGTWRAALANPDGALDPSNTASPYSPNVIPLRQARVLCRPGPNQLTIDQATAGEGSGYGPGAPPAQANVTCAAGYPLTLTATGSAYQGSQVYQVAVPNGAAQPQNLLNLAPVGAVPGGSYSAQVQARVLATAQNLTVSVAIDWADSSGAVISTTAGPGVALTGGSATWVQLSASGAAPAGTQFCTVRAVLATTTSATASAQFDGLQFENSATPTPFQVPFASCANLLGRAIATGTASMAVTDSAANWFTPTIGSVTQAAAPTSAPTGAAAAVAWTSPPGTTSASPLYAGVTAPGAPSNAGPVADCVQASGSTQYTASVYLNRASSADAAVQATVSIRWFNSAGTVAGTTTGPGFTVPVGSWIRASVTGTAPATAVWGRPRIQISSPASTAAANTLYAAGWQMESAPSATAWVDPGTTCSIITPYVERWPQTWDEQDGTYGVSPVIGDDAFVGLSQYTLLDPFIEDVLALGSGPNFCFALNDGAGATSCTDSAGKRPAAPVESGPFGVGSLTFGNSITSATPGHAFIGTAGPVATFANNAAENPPTQDQMPETFVSLHKTSATPGPPASGGWTRLIAFRAGASPGTNRGYTLWDAEPGFWTANASLVSFALDNLGFAHIQWSDFSGAAAWSYDGAANMCDGDWHLLAIGVDPVAGAVIWVDGAVVSTGPPGGNVTGIVTDVLGCAVSAGVQWYDAGLIGDLALAIEYPFLLSNTQMTALYNSWKLADQGESTGARIRRLLSWVGWSGPTAIDTGMTASMGPATDLTGATALDAANNITLTENGNWYASANGTLTFKSRAARYNQLTPQYVFGGNAAVGEWPFENPFAFDDDSSHIASTVQVTQYGGSVFTASDATSSSRFFPRVYQRTVNSTSANECQDAAHYLAGQYKNPHMRVSALRLHPSAVPGLFLVCLSLELGTRIRVNRRPNGAPPIRFDGFIEKIEWEWDPDVGEVFVNLQCSPADLTAYWVLAAARTTLNAQATSGTNTAVIRALPDSAVNALASSLPQGYQLAFEPGTPRAETMTLTATGIPATAPGYTTATLTFTSNFAFTHAANAVVCEPLPVNVTDPASYVAASVLGAASCTVLSGGASGTNTITVGPLAGAAVNALGSVWNVGDLLWISPGAAAFEGYNLLHPNAATAGEGVLPIAAGAAGGAYGVGGFYAAPLVAASATAFQGANVWAAAVAGAAATGHTLINIGKAAVAPLLAFTWSIYVRSATSGQNPTVTANLQWLDASGASLGSATGAGVALTGSPTATWTRLTVSGAAPAGAVWASPSVLLTTAPALAWSFQADALQLEQAAAASVFCATPQVKSVAASVPGYASVQITLNTNLINSHAAGDVVCDPLPAGVTSPAAVGATARLAY